MADLSPTFSKWLDAQFARRGIEPLTDEQQRAIDLAVWGCYIAGPDGKRIPPADFFAENMDRPANG